jgi:Protein of unknown function (DUF2637)
MRRDWLGSLLLLLVCVAAVVASFSTLASLATVAGWSGRASWLLPVCLDALGMVACRSWLSANDPEPARRFAKRIVLGTVVLSIIGNAAGHLAMTHHLSQGILLVVLVGAVPPAGLAVGIHLAVLRGRTTPVPDAAPVRIEKPKPVPADATKPKTAPKTKPSPKSSPVKSGPESARKVDEVLVHRAKKLDEEWMAKHGKQIPRDDARPLLGVSNEKTSEALRLAREGVA